MHEIKLAMETLRQVVDAVERRSLQQVIGITFDVGVLSCVDFPAFEFCFSVAAEGTCAEGAALRFRKTPLALRCLACDCEFRPECPADACTACGSETTQVIAGRDFVIKSLEVC